MFSTPTVPMSLPVSPPPSKADFDAVLNGGAWMPLPQFGMIDASGSDAAHFLHGQLTNDIEHLDGTRARLAGYCSPKGRLLASFLVWRAGGKTGKAMDGPIRLLVSKDIQAAVQKRLSMYVLRAQAKLTDTSDTLLAVGFAGDVHDALAGMVDASLPDDAYAQVEYARSPRAVNPFDTAGTSGDPGMSCASDTSRASGASCDSRTSHASGTSCVSETSRAPDASSPPGTPGVPDTSGTSGVRDVSSPASIPSAPDTSSFPGTSIALDAFASRSSGTRAASCTLIRLPDAVGRARYLLVGPKAFVEARLAANGNALTRVAPAVWDWLDIRAGEARITQPVVEQFVPQMVNYDVVGGVSFRKGCYPGQEVVARSQYRGTIKRRMVLASIGNGIGASPATVRAGAALFHSEDPAQPCGMIVNAAAAPDGGIDLLAELKLAALETGSVHLRAENGPGPALRILPLPYALPVEN